jgi:hypothetical protein
MKRFELFEYDKETERFDTEQELFLIMVYYEKHARKKKTKET